MLDTLSSIVDGAGAARTNQIAAPMAPPAPAIGGPGSAAVGFDRIMEQVAADAIGSLRAGEAASISSIQGKVSAQRVVEAVMSAERTLQLAVAVRDKVVQAYQEVSRMAI
ncbi:flagellar hook-basal body complex protein FliE [Rhodopseudomonas sp. NSM]|uniref:flagellar hook-basal body complex protein FliE n=1 Tax=Rhodopseudomonas sp. NSM TaxID=3457630 RepID=UPI0040360452